MRPRTLDYNAVRALRKSGVRVAVIAKSYGVTREAVYHALREVRRPASAPEDELRSILARIVDAVLKRRNPTDTLALCEEAVEFLEREPA